MVEWRYATLRYARMNRLNPIENAPPYFVPDLHVFDLRNCLLPGFAANNTDGPNDPDH